MLTHSYLYSVDFVICYEMKTNILSWRVYFDNVCACVHACVYRANLNHIYKSKCFQQEIDPKVNDLITQSLKFRMKLCLCVLAVWNKALAQSVKS